tara:strand:+ start:203 stop:334 length:132 start_codon:yes stop_codon:yes gene_type:complete
VFIDRIKKLRIIIDKNKSGKKGPVIRDKGIKRNNKKENLITFF